MTAPESGSGRRERIRQLREAALQRPVLARRPSDGFTGRWSRRQWVQASLFATMGMLVAAIVPGFGELRSEGLQMPRQSMSLPLPPLSLKQQPQAPMAEWQVVRVQEGQTLGALFEQVGVPATTMYRILEVPEAKPALVRLRPGAELGFELAASGDLRGFRFDRDADSVVELTLEADRIDKRVIERPREIRSAVATGEINSSLYAAARKAGLSPAAISVLTDQVFQYDIDFSHAQKGDRFSVVYDQIWREGERIGSGEIQAATFTTGGKTYAGFRFEHDGKVGYYDADGRPLKKAFIRMPIPYARITSRFNPSRKHPVLGKTRAHKGVDYGAGTGTPIMAAGDAKVSFVGWKGGYGRTVILNHGRGHTTLYAHMSRFGKYKRGQSVKQGAVIGYVGASGLVTGPHLHYEFRINGVHRDPLKVTMPPPEPLKGAALVAFRAQTAPALARIQQIEDLHQRNAAVASTGSRPAADTVDKKA